MTAREAVQMAEDARAIAVKRQEENALAAERQARRGTRSARRERTCGRAVRDRACHAGSRSGADQGAGGAERLTREKDAQAAAALAEADRVKRENAAATAAAAAEADRVKRENEARTAAAKTEADSRLAAAGAEADRLKRENEAQKAASQAELDNAAKQKAQSETEKAELRAQLLKQFNAILQTRDTARGLIVNMSDVLFDTGKFTLRPAAREKLAKVAGIVVRTSGSASWRWKATPIASAAMTTIRQLSEHRGESVRDLPDPAGNGGELRHGEGLRKDSARGFQRHRGGPAAESARGTGDLRRNNRHGDRQSNRCQVTGHRRFPGAGCNRPAPKEAPGSGSRMTMFKWTLSLPAVTSFLFFAVMPPATLGADVSKYREFQLGSDLPTVARQEYLSSPLQVAGRIPVSLGE